MKTESTFFANIYLGLKEGYDGENHLVSEVEQIMQDYCDLTSFAVTITPIIFVYKGGRENGAVVGLINYPRFPSTPEDITKRSLEIAQILKNKFKQIRLSVVCPDNTYLLE